MKKLKKCVNFILTVPVFLQPTVHGVVKYNKPVR
jgi:hypothetical protein